ncbi:MAG: hypothetical protein LBV62_00860 [Rickettsiales bacterium]|nr:hypothetical protein [Rickettsiales bacterium]
MKNDTQDAKKGVKKALSTWLNPLIIILSTINTGMSVTIVFSKINDNVSIYELAVFSW